MPPGEGLERLQVRPQRVRLLRLVQEDVVIGEGLDLPRRGQEVLAGVLWSLVLRLSQEVQLNFGDDLEIAQRLVHMRFLKASVKVSLDLREDAVNIYFLGSLGVGREGLGLVKGLIDTRCDKLE